MKIRIVVLLIIFGVGLAYAADRTITALIAIDGASTADDDVLAIVDISEPVPVNKNKKIRVDELGNKILTGNAATATALAVNGTNCTSGDAAGGVDANGNAEDCFTPNVIGIFDVTKSPYNAVCDGVNDDTAEIQAAIDAASAVEGVVVLPIGTCLISSPLQWDVTSGSFAPYMRGQGIESSIIRKTDVFTGTSMIESIGHDSPTYSRRLERGGFKDFRVWCKSNNDSKVDHGIDLEAFAHMRFERVRVLECTLNGFNLGWNFTNRFDQVFADGNKNGLYVGDSVNNSNTIVDSVFFNNDIGVYMPVGGNGISLLGNDIESNTVAGAYLGGIEKVTIDGYFENNGGTGFTFSTFNGGAIDGGNWVVNADIVLNGGQTPNATFDVITDIDSLPRTDNVNVLNAFTSATGGDTLVAAATADNLRINYSGLEKQVLEMHGSEDQVETVVITGVINSQAATAFAVAQPNTLDDSRMTKMFDAEFNYADFGVENFDISRFSITSGSGGSLVDQGYSIAGHRLWAIEHTGTSAYFGTTLNLAEYPQLKGKYVVFAAEIIPLADEFNSSSWGVGGQLRLTTSDGARSGSSSVQAKSDSIIETTGSITTGTASLTVAVADGMTIGDPIVVQGAGAAGATLVSRISNVSGVTITLEDNAGTTVTDNRVLIPFVNIARVTALLPSEGDVTLALRRISGSASEKVGILDFQIYELGAYGSPFLSETVVDSSGSETLSSGTATVTFADTRLDANYLIDISCDANETFYWSAKATTGFTINSSNASSTANCDWSILR